MRIHLWRIALIIAAIMSFASIGSAQKPDKAKPAVERPQEGKLKVGDDAPDFKLKRLHSDEEVALSSFRGKRPVVLAFGSYT